VDKKNLRTNGCFYYDGHRRPIASNRAFRTYQREFSSEFNSFVRNRIQKAGARDFTLLHSVQADTEAHLASCPIGTGNSVTSDKAAGE
jgi:hypothetical protein